MKNKSFITKSLCFAIGMAAMLFALGSESETAAQSRDPFQTPPYKRTTVVRPNSSGGSGGVGSEDPTKPVKKGPQVVEAPPIEARIDYYKRVREQAAENGMPIPKVTSVLLLNEMSVTGIFRTPRGYAAMVEATPINLSYTIYPGEKFFDGQLVAVEENRLVFRKVTKWSNGKFVASVENKALQTYTMQQDIQGTAPAGAETYSRKPESAKAQPMGEGEGAQPGVIVSPLEEMNTKKDEPESAKKKDSKKKAVSKNRRRKN